MSKTYYAKVMNVVAILPLVKLSDFLYRIKAKTLSLTFVTFVTLQIYANSLKEQIQVKNIIYFSLGYCNNTKIK